MKEKTMTPAAVTLQQGTIVHCLEKEYLVTHVLDLTSLLAKDLDTGKVKRLNISDVTPAPANRTEKTPPDLEHIPDERWQLAQERLEIIRPLLNDPQRTRAKVEARASEFGKHVNTLYGWIRLYEECGTLTVLMPQERRDKGQTKVDPQVEEIIKKAIEEEYLTEQQKSPVKVHQEVERLCRNAGLTPPHCNTVRNRINSLPERIKVHRRRGAKEARDRFDLIQGEFPGADYPYAVVQIDHTPLDIITVDEVHRLPLDRPYLTLAIDVSSRMIVGFHVSYDPPGAVSVGLCLSQAILPKETLLAEMDIPNAWPCWGLPKTVHADNAKEFRGAMIKRACSQYGINLEWRPVARPNFGGHIECLLGTVSQELHTLPGTTFSNTRQKGRYKSTERSALTLSELEHWLLIYFTGVYHQRFHSGIGCSPIKKYEEGIFGSSVKPGTGLPPRIVDEFKLKLDFLPFEERTVQEYGIVIDHIFYFSDVLRRWVNATVPGKSKLKQKFIVRRDPRNISHVWFFDPELETYFEIPYRNNTRPSISVWELRAAKKHLLEQGRSEMDEDLIFEAYEKMNTIKTEAERLTKKHRKKVQRKKSRKPLTGQPQPSPAPDALDTVNQTDSERPSRTIKPFDELEDL
jgi:putative transposase